MGQIGCADLAGPARDPVGVSIARRQEFGEASDAGGQLGHLGTGSGEPGQEVDDMLHTVLRRKALGESVEQIQPALIIPTGKRKGQNPSVASIYQALAEHEKTQAYPEAVETAHADFAALQQRDRSPK
jgi:hypothetical protein